MKLLEDINVYYGFSKVGHIIPCMERQIEVANCGITFRFIELMCTL